MRLLSLCSLASGSKMLSYDTIAATRQVRREGREGARDGWPALVRALARYVPDASDDHFEFLVSERWSSPDASSFMSKL